MCIIYVYIYISIYIPGPAHGPIPGLYGTATGPDFAVSFQALADGEEFVLAPQMVRTIKVEARELRRTSGFDPGSLTRKTVRYHRFVYSSIDRHPCKSAEIPQKTFRVYFCAEVGMAYFRGNG